MKEIERIINEIPIISRADVLKALSQYVIKARIEEHKRNCRPCNSDSCCSRLDELESELTKGLEINEK